MKCTEPKSHIYLSPCKHCVAFSPIYPASTHTHASSHTHAQCCVFCSWKWIRLFSHTLFQPDWFWNFHGAFKDKEGGVIKKITGWNSWRALPRLLSLTRPWGTAVTVIARSHSLCDQLNLGLALLSRSQPLLSLSSVVRIVRMLWAFWREVIHFPILCF